jgi:hypothetical protein
MSALRRLLDYLMSFFKGDPPGKPRNLRIWQSST